jgi:biotin carboxyl carrier protein
MITASELRRVVQRLQGSDATFFEYEGPQGILRLRFSRQPGTKLPSDRDARATGQSPPCTGEASTPLRSPGIGFLCVKHPLMGLEPVSEGEPARQGQILAFLRAGDVLTPVVADRDAAAVRPVAQDGALVGYGDMLFELG